MLNSIIFWGDKDTYGLRRRCSSFPITAGGQQQIKSNQIKSGEATRSKISKITEQRKITHVLQSLGRHRSPKKIDQATLSSILLLRRRKNKAKQNGLFRFRVSFRRSRDLICGTRRGLQ